MAVLRGIAAVVAMLAGCYAPDLRDCVVACASSDDCGPDQVCGSDGECAAPSVAGSCSSVSMVPDAGATDTSRPDAAPIDAPPDAPPLATLTIQIAGKGMVTATGLGTCNYTSPSHQCSYTVTPGTEVDLVATGTNGDEFERWQSNACAGEDSTCTVTVNLPSTTVAVKFMH